MPTNPELLKMPFAQDGDKNSIPETTSPTTGLFSQRYGFQSINSLPLTAGGKAISRLDYNGAMYMLSNLLYYMQRGYTFVYDDTMPYVVGCRVLDPNDGQVYNCVADATAGAGAPSVTPANWRLAPSADVLGFRKPNTEYEVGDIAYHASLPTGRYLECTTKGTTSSGELTISSPSIGGTVTDGTVVWTVVQPQLTTAATRALAGVTPAANMLPYFNSSNSATTTVISDFIKTLLDDGDAATARATLKANAQNCGGIVAASLSTDGYVKFANGLILQWGYGRLNGTTHTLNFPISFSDMRFIGLAQLAQANGTAYCYFDPNEGTRETAPIINNAPGAYFWWLAIGN